MGIKDKIYKEIYMQDKQCLNKWVKVGKCHVIFFINLEAEMMAQQR